MPSLLRCSQFACIALSTVAFATLDSSSATAVDRLYEKSGPTVTGQVTQTNKKGVQLKKGNSTQTYFSGDIRKILYEGDPAGLTKGREFALDGQFNEALEELKKVDPSKIKRDVILADVAFYTAMSEARLSLAGKGAKNEAVKKLRSFASAYKDSWHFFDAAKMLGDLALSLGSSDNAMSYYKALLQAQSPDTKVESVYLQGRVHLASKAYDQAMAEFDKVIGLKANTAATVRTQVLAKAGKAVALSGTGKSTEGLALVDGLIAELNPDDLEMAARIYNAQGASYEASGDNGGCNFGLPAHPPDVLVPTRCPLPSPVATGGIMAAGRQATASRRSPKRIATTLPRREMTQP